MKDERPINRPFEQGEFTPSHASTATEHAHIEGTLESSFLDTAVWRAGPIEFTPRTQAQARVFSAKFLDRLSQLEGFYFWGE